MAMLETCVQYLIPMVVFTGVGNETIAAEAIKSGKLRLASTSCVVGLLKSEPITPR